ncbi:MAG: hypothetical protein JO348_05590 [Alphaproteobacteria bacterium]|nr:hypothetical protein [Alphaproteobacteria bacterium]MBV9419227.1 hypothetical protein [Alphaproteobacteria bacterium]MBV9541510.1 hypothetical protein [Alphaproteobacteria bacterium]MBV9903482.1 hypothetical protein [Alphaproteobacteria bacterium]
MQVLSANDLYRLAADLAEEHGSNSAMEYARQAVVSFEAEGAIDRARFWFTMCVFLDDLAEHRLDPAYPVTIH